MHTSDIDGAENGDASCDDLQIHKALSNKLEGGPPQNEGTSDGPSG
jgi:hypothetical protein